MRDLISNLGASQAIGPATLASDTTSAAIDLAGFDSAMIALSVGVGGITFDETNKVEFKVTHCATSDGTFEAVTQNHIEGATVSTGGIVKALTAAHAAASFTKVGYVGGRRFVKIQADFSGTHGTGTPISVTVLKGHPGSAPAA